MSASLDPQHLDDPSIRPFLPMLYIAWADGELTDDELTSFRTRLADMPWLASDARDRMQTWLDPRQPPTAAQLGDLLGMIRRDARTLAPDRRAHLAHYGAALADGDPEVRGALDALMGALELDPSEAARALFDAPSPAQHPAGVEAPGEDAQQRVPVDPAQLRAVLEPTHRAVRSKVRELLSQPWMRIERDQSKEDARAQVRHALDELTAAGLGALAYPGITAEGDDMGGFMAAFEALGMGDLSILVKYGVQFGLFGGSIFFLGDPAQRERWLPAVARGEMLGCYAMTELGHGSNVMGLETTITYDPDQDQLVIHTPDASARKEWIGGAARDARWATVFGQLRVGEQAHGVHAVVVQIRDDDGAPLPGVRTADCGHKLGLNGVDNGRLWFDQVRIPREALLGRFASIDESGVYRSDIADPNKRFFTMLGTLVAGRISVAAGAVSASKVGLSIALRYALHRRQFGDTAGLETRLLDYPAHRRRLLPRLAQTYAAALAVQRVRADYLALPPDADRRAIEATAAGLKAFCTDHATDTLQQCREACGGQGYLSANRIGALKSDTDVFTTFEGDNTVLLQLTAKALLTNFRKQFTDDRIFGVFRYVGRRLGQLASQTNPVTVRLASSEHLRDLDNLRGLFQYRETELVESAVRRIRRRAADGMAPSDAFLDIQNHLLAASRAHVEAYVFDTFAAQVEGAGKDDGNDDDGPDAAATRHALGVLLRLWSLWRVESDLGWFMEHGLVEPARAQGIRREVEALCDEVADGVEVLLEGFDIPPASLAAPIAFGQPEGV